MTYKPCTTIWCPGTMYYEEKHFIDLEEVCCLLYWECDTCGEVVDMYNEKFEEPE